MGLKGETCIIDCQQKLSFCLEHLFDVIGHGIETPGQVAQFVAPINVHTMVQLATAKSLHTFFQGFDREKQASRGTV